MHINYEYSMEVNGYAQILKELSSHQLTDQQQPLISYRSVMKLNIAV